MLKVFEAFSGYGSQSIALRNIGVPYEVVAISEIDKYAIKAYEAIHGKVNNLGDISKIDVEDIPDHDLFTYSFPCQDISVAGKQASLEEGSGTRSSLLWECKKIIKNKTPKFLLMENVKNLVGRRHRDNFNKWLQYLESLGYTNYWEVLNAKDYGVPQNRERVFVVSILGEHKPYNFPSPIKLDKAIRDILEGEVEDKYYINKPWHFTKDDESKHNQWEIAKVDNIKYSVTRSIQDANKICRCLDTMGGGQREPKILIPQATKKGYIEMGVPGICNLSYPNSKTRRDRVQEDGKVSPTITASQQDICYIDKVERTPLKFLNRNGKQTGEDYCFCVDTTNTGGIKEIYNTGDFRVRKLTPRECFRLMGLNDNDIDKIQAAEISNSQQYKMAGNSIVVDVLEGIFRELFLSNNN